ncbi:MAG: DUF4258 domain-containing protein [bacterium]
MNKSEQIKYLCQTNQLRWTNHIFSRLMQRNITLNDISYALLNGEIIEEYPDDYPYPSYLVLGTTINNKYIHIVCGIGDNEL